MFRELDPNERKEQLVSLDSLAAKGLRSNAYVSLPNDYKLLLDNYYKTLKGDTIFKAFTYSTVEFPKSEGSTRVCTMYGRRMYTDHIVYVQCIAEYAYCMFTVCTTYGQYNVCTMNILYV